MGDFRESHYDRSLLAPRQIYALHEPRITTSKRPVATLLLIASGQISETHLTHTKQTGKVFLIASFRHFSPFGRERRENGSRNASHEISIAQFLTATHPDSENLQSHGNKGETIF